MIGAYAAIVDQPGNELIDQSYDFAASMFLPAASVQNGFSTTPTTPYIGIGAMHTVPPAPEPRSVALLAIGLALAGSRVATRRTRGASMDPRGRPAMPVIAVQQTAKAWRVVRPAPAVPVMTGLRSCGLRGRVAS
ncbi:hypothetical protein OJF2_79420 (plasmid) [Aquisphaera giovannonii]|uniref:PEP-CTERM protein-sorting domain-containing protein n=1 Tax=Aquisphaera giovannonii TaxID=406548 RepID=A0A5B9WFL9_9BACT|nr:hypothetical protein OJF2_79420 [Aquisphaera giovannonii]